MPEALGRQDMAPEEVPEGQTLELGLAFRPGLQQCLRETTKISG